MMQLQSYVTTLGCLRQMSEGQWLEDTWVKSTSPDAYNSAVKWQLVMYGMQAFMI